MQLQQLPWLKFLLPLLLGIICSRWISFEIHWAFLLILLSIYFLSNHFYRKYNKSWLYILSFVCLILFGLAYTQRFQLKFQKYHFSKFEGKYAIGIVRTPIENKTNSYQTTLEIKNIIQEHNIINTKGKLLLYIQKDSLKNPLEIGDEILLHLKSNEIEAPKNLKQFDYKTYLSYNDIYHQAYIKNFEYKILAKHQRYFIKRKSDEISKYAQSLLQKYIPDKENFNIADGIFLGHKSEMDIEQYNTFAYLGIVHILSVSGLHVGIIYLLISFCLSFIPNKSKTIYILKFLTAFLLIWLFAFVVGLSPAVVRSALLFSILHLGRILKEDTIPLNILLGAAFIQLLINPLVLYNIGFQLSYLAMLGLYLFYKPIYNVLYSKNKFINWFAQLCSASVAAQIFTLPFAIYYFGNFPTYFLIANIFAIPLSTLILWFCVALLPLQFIPIMAKLTGYLISYLIDIFIYLSKLLLMLPYAKMNTLFINEWQLILCCLAISIFTIYIFTQKIKYALYALSIVVFIIISAYFIQYQNYQQDKLVFYAVNKNLVYGLHQKSNVTIYSKDTLSLKDYNFNVSNTCRYFRNQTVNNDLIKQDLQFIKNKSVYFLHQHNIQKSYQTPLSIDILVLTDNIYLDVERLVQNYHFKQLILSSDLDYKHQKIYSKLLNEAGISFTDLNRQTYIDYNI
ncbi:MAG: ComEC/Rec2 family competence protein [Bacteroidetes bacterium]|nr:ComEC/Rec2 family competence protein [Bacteroidota bacterium]